MAGSSVLAVSTRAVVPRLVVLGTLFAVVTVQLRAPSLMSALTGVLLVVVLAYVAQRHVPLAGAIGLGVIGVLPVYAGRYLGGSQFAVTPALVVALVLLPAAMRELPRFRLVPMDVAVGAFLALRLASTFLNFTGGLATAIGPALYLALPYVAYRLLTLRGDLLPALSGAVVVVGAASGVFAVIEHAGRGNLFFRLPSSGYEYRFFATSQLRFGEVRAEASFGHSIALGMFLALAMVLAVALALEVRNVFARAALVVGAGLILLGALDTLSRGALLTLALGILLWFGRELRRLRLPRVIGLGLVAAGLVALTPVSSTVSQLVESSRGDTVEASSTEHRFAILDLVSDPAQFSVLGKPSAGEGGAVEQVEVRTGLNSFDNAYALVYVSNGALAVLAFLAVGALAFLTLAGARLSPLERAWVAGLCAGTINLFGVNLLTQYRDFYWIAAAIAASAWQRGRESRPRARNAELVRSPG